MDVQISNQLFVVAGASSGFGLAISKALLAEGANIITIARNESALKNLQSIAPERVEILVKDITNSDAIISIQKMIGSRQLHGVLVNAGGPPAKTAMETTMEDWDTAYKNILRWKIELVKALIPQMEAFAYGRIVFIESSSVKQPLENLVLSNSMRLAVVGFVKTLSQEIAATGITLNILAPGSHDTAAIERIYAKKASQTNQPIAQVRSQAIEQIPVNALGNANDFASLAVWLFSPISRYITGQTISVDGGMIKAAFG
jgi:3-oxoacyl-[acyl-carrier protein] reductase